MNATREGRFKALPVEWGVDAKGQNALTCFSAKYSLTEEWDGAEWQLLCPDEHGAEISGDTYIEKKDGNVNEHAVKTLKETFGWDGRDPFWLQDADLSKTVVQVTLENESWQTPTGATRTALKVKWLNPGDSTGGPGGVTKATPEARKSISARLGAKLRALSGGTPATAPKPTAAKPTASAKKAPAGTTPTATADQAWAEWCKTLNGTDQDKWFDALAKTFPGVETDALTGRQWAQFVEMLRRKYPAAPAPAAPAPAPAAKPSEPSSPISEDAEHFKESDIPF